MNLNKRLKFVFGSDEVECARSIDGSASCGKSNGNFRRRSSMQWEGGGEEKLLISLSISVEKMGTDWSRLPGDAEKY